MGAGLLANAVYQNLMYWLTLRFREQARSHILFRVVSVTAVEIHFPAQRFLGLVRAQVL